MSASTPTQYALPPHLQYLEDNLKIMARQRVIYTFIGIAAILFILVTGIGMANASNASSFWEGLPKIFKFPIDMTVEAWESGWKFFSHIVHYFPELLSTVNMAFFSTFVGFCFAAILSCFASKNIVKNQAVVTFTRRMLDLFRSFPELVIAMVLLFLMGKNLLPAVIAITIHTTGALGKLFSEAIENIDQKPLDGLESVGATWTQKVRFGVFPQVMPLFFSYSLLRLEINVRASTILGFVGAGGIGEALNAVIQWRHGDQVMAIMTLLIATIIAFDYLSEWLRGKLIGGLK